MNLATTRLPDRFAERAHAVLAGELTPVVPRLAASVLLVRDGRRGIEVFGLRRSPELRFAGGNLVFPGGAVEPADSVESGPYAEQWASQLAVSAELAQTLRACAVRETAEEVGVRLDHPTIPAHGEQPGVEKLHPMSCWTTPDFEPIRFRAWFFVAELPPDAEPKLCTTEADSAGWYVAREAIAEHFAGALPMWPPQLHGLCLLAQARSVAELVLGLADRPVPWFEPRAVRSGSELRLAHDPAYSDLIAAARTRVGC